VLQKSDPDIGRPFLVAPGDHRGGEKKSHGKTKKEEGREIKAQPAY